jgi:putative ABC transport system ATP-binding protein
MFDLSEGSQNSDSFSDSFKSSGTIMVSQNGISPIMNLIGCLDLLFKGTVFLDSRNIAMLSESELSGIRGEMIGFIFQSLNLIPTLNTEENVMLPMEYKR